MRAIMNISLPVETKKEIEQAVKKGGYISTSEFIRDLLRAWKGQQLLEDIRVGEAEISAGKGKVLRSLKDLR